jgi:lantibiotic modifying enzyme
MARYYHKRSNKVSEVLIFYNKYSVMWRLLRGIIMKFTNVRYCNSITAKMDYETNPI